MKFTHLADIHIGAYNDPKLSKIILDNFKQAIDISLKENVDFVIIAGDLFNVAMPGIDNLKETVLQLKRLKENNIPVYLVAGSHDYSSSGKTIIDILEHTGMLVNVLKGEQDKNGRLNLKFTIDKKTGAKITGILGKRNMLEKEYYEQLNREPLESAEGFKIFIFHTSLSELKPEEMSEMNSIPCSLLPKNFDYYAGGHIHITTDITIPGYKNIVYPGPIFPVNFSELEKLKHGSFVIYDNGKIKRINLDNISTISIALDCTNLTPAQIEQKIINQFPEDLSQKILTLRLFGAIDVKVSDINFNLINSEALKRNAFYVMRNTSKLISKQLREVRTKETSQDLVEETLIKEFSSNFTFKNADVKIGPELIKQLITSLSAEKITNQEEYEKDFLQKTKKLFNI